MNKWIMHFQKEEYILSDFFKNINSALLEIDLLPKIFWFHKNVIFEIFQNYSVLQT